MQGGRHRSGITKGQAGNSRSGSAKIAAEGTRLDASHDGWTQVRNGGLAVRLVQTVGHGTAEQFVTLRSKGCGNQARVGNVEYGVKVRDMIRQPEAGRIGVDLIRWDE